MSIITEAEGFLQTVEQDAVTAWNDILGGIKYLSTEAAALAAWVEKEDPAIQSQIQTFILDGEKAAATVAELVAPAYANLIAGAADGIEQIGANLIQDATGNKAGAVTATAMVTSGVGDLSTILSSLGTVGITKALAALASAAAPITSTVAAAPTEGTAQAVNGS
jgi:hypothetical protein